MADFMLTGAALDRLRRAVREAGSQKDLAEKAEIPPTTLSQILKNGGDVSVSRLGRLAAALDQPIDNFVNGSGGAGGLVVATDHLRIKEIDLAYGMGATWVDGIPVTEKAISFPAEWVRQFTKAPADALFFARGAGDSMMSTILDGDIILIDTMQKTPTMADRIWVLSWGGMGMIKRLRGDPNGGLKLLSDNPSVPPETAYDGEAQVIGRVVAIIRKV